MKHFVYVLATLSSTLLTSACGSSMKNPDIKQNPNPKMRYEITLAIQGAPGPFDSINGYAFYKVENQFCTPLQPISGARLPPEKDMPIVLERVADNVLRGTIYLDPLRDEDYFGLGVCHWQLQSINISSKFGEASFDSFLFADQIVRQESFKQYFPRKAYGDNSIKDMNYTGLTSLEEVKPQYRNDFFSTVLTAKEHIE